MHPKDPNLKYLINIYKFTNNNKQISTAQVGYLLISISVIMSNLFLRSGSMLKFFRI